MLDPLEARALLGEGCFLRRSKTADILWVSDAPLRFDAPKRTACQRALSQAGFAVRALPTGLWGIDPGQTRWLVLLSAWEAEPRITFAMSEPDLAAYSLAGILRAHPSPLTSQPLEWIRALYQAEADDARFNQTCERLISKAAETLRRHEVLPSAAAGLIYRYLLDKRRDSA